MKDLKNIWEQQKGICPLTGWELKLPDTTDGWKNPPDIRRASLDRIDSSRPYEIGNIRFISVIANYAKNSFTDQEVIEFCKAVSDYKSL